MIRQAFAGIFFQLLKRLAKLFWRTNLTRTYTAIYFPIFADQIIFRQGNPSSFDCILTDEYSQGRLFFREIFILQIFFDQLAEFKDIQPS